MKIRLKLFVLLLKYLPAGATGGEVELEVEEGTTPLQIIEKLKIPFKGPLKVAVNGVKLHTHEIETRTLHKGEIMQIFPPIAGG